MAIWSNEMHIDQMISSSDVVVFVDCLNQKCHTSLYKINRYYKLFEIYLKNDFEGVVKRGKENSFAECIVANTISLHLQIV